MVRLPSRCRKKCKCGSCVQLIFTRRRIDVVVDSADRLAAEVGISSLPALRHRASREFLIHGTWSLQTRWGGRFVHYAPPCHQPGGQLLLKRVRCGRFWADPGGAVKNGMHSFSALSI